MEIDWNRVGTLKHTGGGYDIRTDPLRILVPAARQGHEGEVSDMLIVMDDGTVIPPDGILRLALMSMTQRRWEPEGMRPVAAKGHCGAACVTAGSPFAAASRARCSPPSPRINRARLRSSAQAFTSTTIRPRTLPGMICS